MTTKLFVPFETSRQLACALSKARRNEASMSSQQSLATCRDEIAKRINLDPKERDGILQALASAEQSLSDRDLKRLSTGEAAIQFFLPDGRSFRAEVVYAQPVDLHVIENLILGAAPESDARLHEIWQKHNPEFVIVPDSPGITLKARDSEKRIIYDHKTLRIFSLLGHAAWRVFVCHCPHVLLSNWTGTPINAEMMWNDAEYPGAHDAFEEFLDAAQNAVKAGSADSINWPGNLCDVAADPLTLNREQRAIRDLTLMAIAYAFLHEIRHVMFRHPEENKIDDAAEELACDTFARDFLLGHASDYVARSGEPINMVMAKRASAISLGAFAVYELTAPEHRRGSSTYPPFADRFDALIALTAVPADTYFWIFAATLLLAVLRRQNYSTPLHAKIPRQLCTKMIEAIRSHVWTS
jgi:Peptidase U49